MPALQRDITVKEDKKTGKMKIKIFNSAKYEVICRGFKTRKFSFTWGAH